MLPLISVLIPVYEVEEYLDRCVQSVLAQTYENFEETPQNMKDEKLERLAAELVKHKTSVYKKYLKE